MRCKVISTVFNLVLISLKKFSIISWALLLGVPADYALSRFDFKGKSVINAFFVSPILIPGIVLGFAFLRYIVGTYQLPIYAALFVGHTVIMLPFIIRVISSSLSTLTFPLKKRPRVSERVNWAHSLQSSSRIENQESWRQS